MRLRKRAERARDRKRNLCLKGASESVEELRPGRSTDVKQAPVRLRAMISQHRGGDTAFERDRAGSTWSLALQFTIKRRSKFRAQDARRLGAVTSNSLRTTSRSGGTLGSQASELRIDTSSPHRSPR